MKNFHAAIVILNFNGSQDTLECLESLGGSDPACNIVVVDNGSTDSSVEDLVHWAQNKNIPLQRYKLSGQDGRAPQVVIPEAGNSKITLLETGRNLGFAAGNNIGIRYALQQGMEYILILNNDTVAYYGLILDMIRVSNTENAGIVGVRICYYDEPNRVWFLGGKFQWWNSCMLQGTIAGASNDGSAFPTEWITGCCMLIRKNVFERIGLFDENAFLYCEDVDFCQRAAYENIRRVVTSGVTISHKISRSSGGNTAFTWYHYSKSRIYFHRKHYSWLLHAIFLMVYVLSRFLRCLPWLFRGRLDLVKASWQAIVDAYKEQNLGSTRFRPAAEYVAVTLK